MSNRIGLARFVYLLDAVLGILAIGGASLYGAAYAPDSDLLRVFFSIFLPFAALWALFCYLAYKGLTSDNVVLKFLFWLHVVCHVFAFPVGTGIAAVCIWLWRDLRKRELDPAVYRP